MFPSIFLHLVLGLLVRLAWSADNRAELDLYPVDIHMETYSDF